MYSHSCIEMLLIFYADFVTCMLLILMNFNNLLIKFLGFFLSVILSTNWDHLAFSFLVCMSFISFSYLLSLYLSVLLKISAYFSDLGTIYDIP